MRVPILQATSRQQPAANGQRSFFFAFRISETEILASGVRLAWAPRDLHLKIRYIVLRGAMFESAPRPGSGVRFGVSICHDSQSHGFLHLGWPRIGSAGAHFAPGWVPALETPVPDVILIET